MKKQRDNFQLFGGESLICQDCGRHMTGQTESMMPSGERVYIERDSRVVTFQCGKCHKESES